MRRRKRTGRPHATANRPGECVKNVAVDNTLPLAKPPKNSKRPAGWIAFEDARSADAWREKWNGPADAAGERKS